MAYLPPHKRHSNEPSKSTPVPSSIIPQFNRTLTLKTPKKTGNRRRQEPSNQGGQITYAPDSISRWFTAGSDGNDPIPASIRLEPFDCEEFERKNGAKPLVLGKNGVGEEVGESPWVKIAERIEPDLIGCFKSALKGLESESEEMKLSVVSRMGRILFVGNSVDLESIRKAAVSEADSRKQVRKLFYTDVPSVYMEKIQHLVVPEIGFDFDSEKEHYHVKVVDKCRLDSTITCKCTVENGGRELHIYKIELNQVRHLVVDISCMYKDLDLRLMLVTKRMMKSLDDEENDGINKLIKSAVIDPNVKGGLRWPLGKECVADRFSVVGVWHTKCKTFKSQTMKLELRNANRFDHRISTGETSTEVTLKLTGISKYLRDGDVEQGLFKEMIQDAVKLMWSHFLS